MAKCDICGKGVLARRASVSEPIYRFDDIFSFGHLCVERQKPALPFVILASKTVILCLYLNQRLGIPAFVIRVKNL